nr:TPA_asm: hypothetical protein HUJ06_004366 [Nelumbo nucifera]
MSPLSANNHNDSSNYIIYHPDKLTLYDIFKMLVLQTSLGGCESVDEFVECPSNFDRKQLNATRFNVLVWMLQKVMIRIRKPLKLVGSLVEFTLNLVSINGGLLRLVSNIFSWSVEIPNKDTADFQSAIAFVDGRKDLYKASSLHRSHPAAEVLDMDDINKINTEDLCIMAAKVAYENREYVHNVVTQQWKMHFEEFYGFHNRDDILKESDTQAFIFCDRPEKARLIVVAFRGTEIANGTDWLTDLDISWISVGEEIGRVHVGFMRALGLQGKGCRIRPKVYKGKKPLAYYTIRERLETLLKQNENAKILVTGHSLGGALAILFVAGLVYHKEDALLNNLWRVYTFGQPRVGDDNFGRFMDAKLNGDQKRYFRVVYGYDIVPRLPFSRPITEFVHFGECLYYSSWYKAQVLKEEPNENYCSPWFFIPMHFNAWLDLVRAIFVGIKEGKSFEESPLSLCLRALGLLIPGLSSHSPRDYINGARLRVNELPN